MVPPEGKESPGVTSITPRIVGHFMGALVSPPWIAGDSVGLNHWESDGDGEGGDASSTGSWQTKFPLAEPT